MRPAPGNPTAGYMIRGGRAGKDRLDVLDLAYRAGTAELLRRTAVPEGARCLDLGAGGGHATRQLSRAAGPAGRVIGVDTDPAILDLARADTKSEGLSNIEYQVADAAALPFEDGYFDTAYARLLLTHLPNPQTALHEMIRVLRPGGTAIIEDLDWDGVFCHPPSAAFERYRALHARLHQHRGGDPWIGPKLPTMLRRAGLVDIELSLAHPAHVTGPAKTLHTLTLENINDALADAGFATTTEVEELHREMTALAADPETVIAQPRVYQVWGRRV